MWLPVLLLVCCCQPFQCLFYDFLTAQPGQRRFPSAPRGFALKTDVRHQFPAEAGSVAEWEITPIRSQKDAVGSISQRFQSRVAAFHNRCRAWVADDSFRVRLCFTRLVGDPQMPFQYPVAAVKEQCQRSGRIRRVQETLRPFNSGTGPAAMSAATGADGVVFV